MGQTLVGVKIGSSFNRLLRDIDINESVSNEPLIGTGYDLIVRPKIDKLDRFALSARIGLLQKNYALKREGVYYGLYQDFINSYLHISLGIDFKMHRTEKIDLFYCVGLFGSYWMSSYVNSALPDILSVKSTIDQNGLTTQYFSVVKYSGYSSFSTIKDNRFEIGLCLSLKSIYKLSKSIHLIGEFDFYQSFTDQQKAYMKFQKARINQTYYLSLGVAHNF